MINFKYMKNILPHLRKIQAHRKWVRHYCFGIGLYKQGLLHDLSKYSPIEFWEGVRYYQGDSSPIDAAKKEQGYSMAWFHHRGRNLHHYVSWIDNFDETGGTPILMPYKYFAEMVCDFLAAGRTYNGANFRFSKELAWWESKRSTCVMHERLIAALDYIFEALADHETSFMNDGINGTKMVDEIFVKGYGYDLINNAYEHYVEMSDEEWRKSLCGD